MRPSILVDLIIPAYNEEAAIGLVIDEIPKHVVRDIIVCNNNSTDFTAQVAAQHGATVVFQPLAGYGNACLKGMELIAKKTTPPDVVVFLDGDHSDYPEQMVEMIALIAADKVDMIIGSRVLGKAASGSLMPQQRFGNWLATSLLRFIYGVRYTDLGPFRAIRYTSLVQLQMADRTYGWTAEMQVKAAKLKLRTMEIPVDYRVRIGQSKVSGTVKGTIGAGYKILLTLFRYW